MEVKMADVKQVAHEYNMDRVNRYLALGWVIVSVAPGTWSDTREAHNLYALGWPHALPAKMPPEF